MTQPIDTIQIQWLGRTEYLTAWEQQKRLVQQVGAGELPHQLLLLEHPPTITFGRKGKPEHLLLTEEQLAAEGITRYDVDRGGDVTYHGIGQLVGYPILNLRQLQTNYPDPSRYLRDVEQTLIDTLKQFHIDGWRYPGYTGVWVHHLGDKIDDSPIPEPHKIAAIGVKFNGNGVSSHGFALNIDPNMAHFDAIIPCGIHEHNVTSMVQLGVSTTVFDVAQVVIEAFTAVFNLSHTP